MKAAAMTAPEAAVELLARVLYAEAGTRPVRAIEALAALALRRALLVMDSADAALRLAGGVQPSSLARAVIAVLQAPFQFPCRHPRHPAHPRFVDPPPGDPALALCRRIAGRALRRGLPDAAPGALLWHDDARLPGWAIGHVPLLVCGGLSFYATGPCATAR